MPVMGWQKATTAKIRANIFLPKCLAPFEGNWQKLFDNDESNQNVAWSLLYKLILYISARLPSMHPFLFSYKSIFFSSSPKRMMKTDYWHKMPCGPSWVELSIIVPVNRYLALAVVIMETYIKG